MPSPDAVDSFITRRENSGAAERANYQMFLSALFGRKNQKRTKQIEGIIETLKGMRVKLRVNSWSGGLRSADAHEKANE